MFKGTISVLRRSKKAKCKYPGKHRIERISINMRKHRMREISINQEGLKITINQ